LNFARASHCFDFFTAHHHHPTVMQLRRFAVKDVRGLKEINGFGLRTGWSLSRWNDLREGTNNSNDKQNQECKSHVGYLLEKYESTGLKRERGQAHLPDPELAR